MPSSKNVKKPEYISAYPVDKLIPYARNARTHSKEQVAQIAASIYHFGFTNAVLIDENDGIIAGHGRVLAAQKLDLKEVPCFRLSYLTENEKQAYILQDNKLALNAGWDEDMLKLELESLKLKDFDLSLTGFGEAELLNIIGVPETASSGNEEDDNVPDLPFDVETVTQAGQVWILGAHRVMCGDSTSLEDVNKLLNHNAVDMVLTDPHYGISIVSGANKVGGGGKFGGKVGGGKIIPSNTYKPIQGDDSIDTAIKAIEVIKKLKPKVQVIWGGNYYANQLENSSCWLVWDKNNTGNFADAELAWTNQDTAVRIFKHTWNGMIKDSEHGQKRVHPTQKPVALSEWCLENYGQKIKTVLDLFGGSGSSLIACEKMGKAAFIMEIDPYYCDVIIKRWEDYTGETAILADS